MILGLRYLCYWGQLNSSQINQGKIDGITEEVILKMHEKIKLLDFYQKLYCTGRSKPVDYDILAQSGDITSKFSDSVQRKLSECDGDPNLLLAALKKIPRFRTENIEHLRDYLTDAGFIPDEQPLSNEDLNEYLVAQIKNMDLSFEEAQNFINVIAG